jgi:deoxyribose-phosphate aldolase
MNQLIEKYPMTFTTEELEQDIAQIHQSIEENSKNSEILKLLFSCIDLTTLNTTDSSYSVNEFVEKVNQFQKDYPDLPNVAAICVYPVFAPVLKSSLKAKGVNKAVVSAGFPSSQTFTDIKKLETIKAIEFGVDEVDVVIAVGEFLEGNYEFVFEELIMLKEAMGKTHLKVILETGALTKYEDIWIASILAMEAGADFIKTSTGKMQPAATPEAVYVMTKAVASYYDKKAKKVGLKPAGGISTAQDALVYYGIVKNNLGEEWLNNELFRLGASRLANNLLSDILSLDKGTRQEINFF